MKLSDIKGERALDVLADLIDPVAEIMADKDRGDSAIREGSCKGDQVVLEEPQKSRPCYDGGD